MHADMAYPHRGTPIDAPVISARACCIPREPQPTTAMRYVLICALLSNDQAMFAMGVCGVPGAAVLCFVESATRTQP